MMHLLISKHSMIIYSAYRLFPLKLGIVQNTPIAILFQIISVYIGFIGILTPKISLIALVDIILMYAGIILVSRTKINSDDVASAPFIKDLPKCFSYLISHLVKSCYSNLIVLLITLTVISVLLGMLIAKLSNFLGFLFILIECIYAYDVIFIRNKIFKGPNFEGEKIALFTAVILFSVLALFKAKRIFYSSIFSVAGISSVPLLFETLTKKDGGFIEMYKILSASSKNIVEEDLPIRNNTDIKLAVLIGLGFTLQFLIGGKRKKYLN